MMPRITWEQTLRPSSGHGVTTAVIGNCGVGFAPCRPDQRDMLMGLMEGVEDIPELVMAAGIPWTWETFPEYLDWLDTRDYDIDFGALVPHSPVRVYAMGKRGADREPATGADLSLMARIVGEAVGAGALGFSTSRSVLHRTKAGALVPTSTSGEEEIRAIAMAMRSKNAGVIQLLDDFNDVDANGASDMDMLRRLSAASGRPISFPVLEYPSQPGMWRHLLEGVASANADGIALWATVFPRAVSLLFGLDTSVNPFIMNPSYQPLLKLSLAERVEALRDADLRQRLINEEPMPGYSPLLYSLGRNFDKMFKLNDPPQYMPDKKTWLRTIASEQGISTIEAAYDALLEFEGHQLLVAPGANFNEDNFDHVHEMLKHPNAVVALGDGGAHYGLICDAGYTTFMLTYWGRDRLGGPRIPLADIVKALTRTPAMSVGLQDRGLIAPGYRADINIINFDRLGVDAPHMVRNLPGGGRRLMQNAEGYVATLVKGTVISRDGVPTGARPGRLIRGAKGDSSAVVH